MPKILIADDEPHIRLLLEQTLEDLEDAGVQLIMAADGEEALAQIQAERPELVLLDIMMPNMSGFDVCERVRQDSALASTCIILLTAKGQEFDRRRGLEVGADLYITKPFNPDHIVEQARRILKL